MKIETEIKIIKTKAGKPHMAGWSESKPAEYAIMLGKVCIGTITNPFNTGKYGWRATFNGEQIDLFTNSLKETKERALAHIAHLITPH